MEMGQSMPHGQLEQGGMNSTIHFLWISVLGLLMGSSSLEESAELQGRGAACKMPAGAACEQAARWVSLCLLTPRCHEVRSRTCLPLTPGPVKQRFPKHSSHITSLSHHPCRCPQPLHHKLSQIRAKPPPLPPTPPLCSYTTTHHICAQVGDGEARVRAPGRGCRQQSWLSRWDRLRQSPGYTR